MLRAVRWVLIGICLFMLMPLLTERGGLGEYARGGSLTTAHLPGTCSDGIDGQERSHISCPARWRVEHRAVDGTVLEVDPAGARPVQEGASGSPIEVRLPVTDLRVFADGGTARQADPKSMTLGAGFLAALAALLTWETVAVMRRLGDRRSVARLGRLEPA